MLNQTHLAHHGIKGMKWGVRRFQNADGTLTDAGKKRYGYNYRATGGTTAKPGIESEVAGLSIPKWRSHVSTKNGVTKRTEEFYNDSAMSMVRRQQNHRITKDKQLRKLNLEYQTARRAHGESSEETRDAKTRFEQRAQDLAVSQIKKYRNAYIKDMDLHVTRQGKRELDRLLMNEVYLGPSNWDDNMNEAFRRYAGLPKSL